MNSLKKDACPSFKAMNYRKNNIHTASMKFLFATVLSLCLCMLAYGQGTVSGKVVDGDGNELASVPVYLLQQRDSSVVERVVTDNEGHYRMELVPQGSYYLRATMFGSSSPLKRVMLWNGSHLTVDLCINQNLQLKEVEVVSTGITVSGDTTSYVVDRFTSGSERNLKEVLDRLPDIRVDENSKSITAGGKHVSRILLEGEDLFQGNTSIPLENLSAQGVRDVQIIDNYSEYNIYEGFNSTGETVLNVGVDEKSKNRVKGEIEGYGGVMDKYSVRDASMYIGKRAMLSAIVSSNNTGDRLLTFQDILQFSGGISNLLSGENPMEELSKKMEAYSAFTNGRRDIMKRENSMASLNVTANPGRKVKLSIGGIYGYDHYRSLRENGYSYLSGLEYTEEAKDRSNQHNGLLNLKVAYMSRKDLNVIYSGNMLLAAQDKHSEDNLMEQNDLAFQTAPKTLYAKNNLLVAKRLGKHLLNLSLDWSVSRYKESSRFESTYTYFTPSMGLDDAYDYDYRRKENLYAAQLFYLHRLSESYYLRVALKAEEQKQSFTTLNSQATPTTLYDNDAHLDYTDGYAEAMLGKDKGKIDFSLRLRYALFHASTDMGRSFVHKNAGSPTPMAQLKYRFTPYHYLMITYDYGLGKNAIGDLVEGQWLQAYNQVVYSNVDRLFSPSHKLSLTHLLLLPYVGLNMLNMVSYEDVKYPIVNGYSQVGYVSEIEKRQGSRQKLLTLLSSAEYKFVGIPLNARYNVSYNYSCSPMYYDATRYDMHAGTLALMLQLVTFYKRGFNGDLQWQLSRQGYKGLPVTNRLATNDLKGLLSWQNEKLYACIEARLSTYNLNHVSTRNMYYGFECRYALTKEITLKLLGTDAVHL
ncbi:MAG: carboxypeptidase-like regulatory domain-containing protein, partial [Prevotellaceae bacterium]|nr:carboxypeptidase-like regulatory domain-containing protein [Prevotellaceae bacterium]